MSTLQQTVVLLISLLFLHILGAITAALIIRYEFSSQLKAELKTRFETVAADIEANGFHPDQYPKYNGEVVYFLADETSAASAPEGIFDLRGAIDDDFGEDELIFDTDPSKDDWYYYVDEAAGSVLVIGTNLAYSSLFAGLVPKTFLAVGFSVSFIAFAIGIAISRRTQKKLDRMSKVLGQIGRGELQRRIALTTDRDDLDDLANEIDNTLEHLEVLFNQTRNLAVNIAHDLKTPLARLRLRLENALLDSDPEVISQNVSEAMSQADEIIAVFEAFLRIARLESGTIKKRFVDVDLVDVANEVASTYAAVVEDAGFVFDLKIDGGAKVRGEAVLLAQMLSNLIENAMRHTERGTTITIVVDDTGIGVADDGKGIPEDAYEQVIKPSVRLDSSRSIPGAGLGLALVKSIAVVHDAKLVLSESPWSASRGLLVFARFS